MPNYNQSKIYKVICSETQKIYIGSTCQPLYKRLFQHKSSSNQCMSKTFINPTIVLIENFSCENKEQLIKRERYYIDSLECVNKNKPGRSKKEYYHDNIDKISENHKHYYQDNIDKILEYHKQYYQDNKDKIAENQKQYQQDNKDKIAEYHKQYKLDNKDKIKEYYQDNREKRIEQVKQYNQDNKDKISEYQKQYHQDNREKRIEKNKIRTDCECGGYYRYNGKARHLKSKKHITHIDKQGVKM